MIWPITKAFVIGYPAAFIVAGFVTGIIIRLITPKNNRK